MAGIVDNIAAHVAGKFGVPHQAAHGALQMVARAHAGDTDAIARLKNASPRVQQIAAHAYAHLKQTPQWWTSHYLALAHAHPLPPNHPYARHIAAALRRAPAAHSGPRAHAAGRGGHGGGGGHGGHGGGGGRGLRHAMHEREEQAAEFGGTAWGGPWGWGTEYLLLDQNQSDQTPNEGDLGPEWNETRQGPGGN